MDALKTKRKSLRTSFTTTANKLKECLAKKEDAKDGDKLRAVKSQLQDKFLRLDEIQNKISSLLLENNETAAEYESDFQAAEDYRDNFLELKSKIETLLNKDFGSFLESPPELDVVGHLAKRCHSSVRCLICKRRQYPLLCPDLRKGKESNFSPKDRTADNEQRSTETLLTNLPSEHEIYLKTIMIRLRNRDKEVCARALLDDGSQRSYIEKNLAAELFLSPSGREIFSQGLFGGGISPASEHKRYMVNVESLNRKYSTPLSLLEQQKICSTLPRIHDRKLLSELSSRGIKLTDVGRDSPPIRVLLGADILGSILTGRIEVLSSGVSAVETLLGWTILGLGKKKEVVNLVTLSLQNMDVPKMWDLEVLGITDPIEKENESLLEEETLTHFKETIRLCEDQRYEVALPWLAGHPALCDKYDAAESRLRTATKRLINENYLEAYDNVFKQWESEETVDSILRTTSKTYFWCDSMVVLSWIKKKEPWYGGFWERMVRSIKELLRKCLGKACVTYEEMLTLLSDCEATINGRPLTYLSDDPKELKPLTPAHFIQDIKERETFDLDLIDSQHMLKRVRYLHTLRSNLRKRFYKEYLGELVRSPKVSSRRKIISPGEIVIVESKNPNRMNWPLAQVIELFPGKDGVERVAKLRLASGEIIRPLQRIYPLELSASDHLIEDHHGTDIATQNPGPTATDVLKEGKKSRWGRPLIPVKRLNL
ncbi:integrase catalytic domain-containing protein [Trichonephila clavata]|uniref:Integrase catalytic domain-containing protein n=1 Tax=Trichonephila clavata TaxID=2740835 RepID=A0A8X6H5Z2_TRICU|nr:integrase catalytic domain-containing protein [Trichonephila clavata]